MGFEPTIPASERAKAVHSSERSATVTGCIKIALSGPQAEFFLHNHKLFCLETPVVFDVFERQAV
jgi:hypothetical protein